MAGDYNLGVVVSAVDNVTRPMRRIMRGVSGTVNRAGRTLMRFSTRIVAGVGRALMRLARIAALAGTAIAEELVRRSVNAFASYEQAVVNALSVTGLMGKEFDKAKGTLTAFGLALSVQSNKMVTEIAGAFYALASAGLNLNQVMAASRGVLALAEGTLAEMGLTTELTTSMMKAFQLPATAMNRIVNALAATIGASRMNMERLAAAIPYAATTAQQFKISLEGMLAALAMAVDRGLEATMAGTQFRMMLAQSTKVTKEGAAALKKYGIGAAAVNIAQRGLVPVLKVLHRAQLKYSDLVKIFGLRAATMAAVLKDNVGEFVDLTKRVTGTNRAFQMQRQQLNSVQGQWRAFKGDVQKLQVEFAQRLEPQLRRVIDRLREFVQALSKRRVMEGLANAIDKLIDKVGEFTAAFTAQDMGKIVDDFLVPGIDAFGNFAKDFMHRVRAFTWMMEKMFGEEWGARLGEAIGYGLDKAFAAYWRRFSDFYASLAEDARKKPWTRIFAPMLEGLADIGAMAEAEFALRIAKVEIPGLEAGRRFPTWKEAMKATAVPVTAIEPKAAPVPRVAYTGGWAAGLPSRPEGRGYPAGSMSLGPRERPIVLHNHVYIDGAKVAQKETAYEVVDEVLAGAH